MKLTDLDGHFVNHASANSFHVLREHTATSIVGAQGILFQCPTCGIGKPRGRDEDGNHIVGDHYILVWFANPRGAEPVAAEAEPAPRWTASGEDLDSLTLSPSVDCTKGGGCAFHGWVSHGEAA